MAEVVDTEDGKKKESYWQLWAIGILFFALFAPLVHKTNQARNVKMFK